MIFMIASRYNDLLVTTHINRCFMLHRLSITEIGITSSSDSNILKFDANLIFSKGIGLQICINDSNLFSLESVSY